MRLIARMDIKGDRMVKGIALEGLRSFGPPEEYARFYEREGADELLFMDAVASLYGRNSLLDMISRVSRRVRIPLIVGGGLRSLEDIERALAAGADRVAINSAALERPTLINESAARFGTSTVIVSIEAKRMPDGSYQAYAQNGREPSGREVRAWAGEAQSRGAGEILITSIDRDGTGDGFDLRLIDLVSSAVGIPVVASGGAGCVDHLSQLRQCNGVGGAAIASLVHFSAAKELGISLSFDCSTRVRPATFGDIRKSLQIPLHSTLNDAPPAISSEQEITVGIVSTSTGNISSVCFAAEAAGMNAAVVSRPEEMREMQGMILPGVGAFDAAMSALHKSRLREALVDWAHDDRPLMGICLGMQLLFSESLEFRVSRGLGIFEGQVRPLRERIPPEVRSPQTGWMHLLPGPGWGNSHMSRLPRDVAMYFMHSYYVEPAEKAIVTSMARCGGFEYCASVQKGNVCGFQFHPERSGSQGLQIYHRFADSIRRHLRKEGRDAHEMCHAGA